MARRRARRAARGLTPGGVQRAVRFAAAAASATLLAVPVSAEAPGAAVEGRRPRYARVDGDIEVVWQRPAGEPKGIFFIAHGCMHQGTDIFSEVGPDGWVFEACRASNFGRCLGLPEEVRLRQAARQRGYLAMAVSGGRGVQSCWDQRRDAARVAAAVQHVRELEALPQELPVLATGASSGGAFMGRLAQPLAQGGLPGLICIVPQIMGTNGVPNRGVPALYVHMPKDRRTAAAVEMDVDELRSEGTSAEQILVAALPVTAELLGRCLGGALAAEVVEALRQANLLDGGGYLTRDARTRLWVDIVQQAIAGRSDDSLVADESCIAEVLNVAWAKHEFTSQYAEEMLDFCEGQGRYASDAATHKVSEGKGEL